MVSLWILPEGSVSAAVLAGLACCGHEAADHMPLCGECGAAHLHGYCPNCRRRTRAVLACPGRQVAVSQRLAAEYRQVADLRRLGYAG